MGAIVDWLVASQRELSSFLPTELCSRLMAQLTQMVYRQVAEHLWHKRGKGGGHSQTVLGGISLEPIHIWRRTPLVGDAIYYVYPGFRPLPSDFRRESPYVWHGVVVRVHDKDTVTLRTHIPPLGEVSKLAEQTYELTTRLTRWELEVEPPSIRWTGLELRLMCVWRTAIRLMRDYGSATTAWRGFPSLNNAHEAASVREQYLSFVEKYLMRFQAETWVYAHIVTSVDRTPALLGKVTRENEPALLPFPHALYWRLLHLHVLQEHGQSDAMLELEHLSGLPANYSLCWHVGDEVLAWSEVEQTFSRPGVIRAIDESQETVLLEEYQPDGWVLHSWEFMYALTPQREWRTPPLPATATLGELLELLAPAWMCVDWMDEEQLGAHVNVYWRELQKREQLLRAHELSLIRSHAHSRKWLLSVVSANGAVASDESERLCRLALGVPATATHVPLREVRPESQAFQVLLVRRLAHLLRSEMALSMPWKNMLMIEEQRKRAAR